MPVASIMIGRTGCPSTGPGQTFVQAAGEENQLELDLNCLGEGLLGRFSTLGYQM